MTDPVVWSLALDRLAWFVVGIVAFAGFWVVHDDRKYMSRANPFALTTGYVCLGLCLSRIAVAVFG